jgi:hydroxypyruvate reductase
MAAMIDPKTFLLDLLHTSIAAAQPAVCVPPHLPEPAPGRTFVIGAGKASAAMARAVEETWAGPLEGLVVTQYGYGVQSEAIEIVEAAHPLPDTAGVAAARRILKIANTAGVDDLVLCLISGGGSALLTLPDEGLTLDDKQQVNRALLASNATIDEINCVRKHLSAIKGGRLAMACDPARNVTLLISDVPGDDPADIASGPTIADRTKCSDALAVLEKYGIDPPPPVAAHLSGGKGETPDPDDPRFSNASAILTATPQASLEAAAEKAHAAGITPYILGDAIEGEAREVAAAHAAMAKKIAQSGHPVAAPAVLLSGGETTVTVHGQGKGGRNTEFQLALALALENHPAIFALAADTDGIDGTGDNAGAYLTPDTLARAQASGIDAKAYLEENDGYGFFAAIDDLVMTGPTFTNVNDFRAIFITS